MAVFRVEKTKDYTVMANHHLRNIALSLKAKGLLSLMLSLPENWDYTTKGLSCICKDGIDSINATIKELEEHGQPLEVILKHYIEVRFLKPKQRPYKTNNFYALLIRQDQLDKEVKHIVEGRKSISSKANKGRTTEN